MLGGWLHRHTRFVAGKYMRAERRRQLRERQAAEMNALKDDSQSNLAQVALVLDDAIGQLDPEDRNAILLQFFERKDFRGVGDALGSSEDAARKRVERAREKLHVILKQRGATLSAVAQQHIALDQIVPTLDQLGAGWAPNRVAAFIP
jgi:RNA polymerase sigma factor (sigma-70 family)